MDKMKLEVGTAWADITPPLELGLLTSSVKGTYEPFLSVRSPLKAKVVALKSQGIVVALVSLDLLGLTETVVGDWKHFKEPINEALPGGTVIITCTHTHNAPESVGLSPLYELPRFKTWLADLRNALIRAITCASASLRPCKVRFAVSSLQGYSLQRRIANAGHVVLSDSMQPISKHLMDRQPVDRRVRTMRFIDDQANTVATVVHTACHPVHEMCLPQVSADFPGDLCAALERTAETGMALFLNGAAGDVNPPTVSMGAAYAVAHGNALAEVARRAIPEEQAVDGTFVCLSREIALPVRQGVDWLSSSTVDACLHVLAFGPLAIVFLPGEPFTEVSNAIEHASPYKLTVVVAYGESSIGYLPTASAFDDGGYETETGRWSYLAPGAAVIVQQETIAMLKESIHSV